MAESRPPLRSEIGVTKFRILAVAVIAVVVGMVFFSESPQDAAIVAVGQADDVSDADSPKDDLANIEPITSARDEAAVE